MAGGLVEYTRTVPANGRAKIAAAGTTVFIKSVSGTLKMLVRHGMVNSQQTRGVTTLSVADGQKQIFPPSLGFYELEFVNDTASDAIVTVVAGDGDYEEPSQSGGVGGTVASFVSVTPGSTDFEIAENENRLGVFVHASIANRPPDDETENIEVYSVLNGNPLGIFLWPGESCFIPTTAAVWVEGENVLDPKFYYFELEQ